MRNLKRDIALAEKHSELTRLKDTTSIRPLIFAVLTVLLLLVGHNLAPDLPPQDQIQGYFSLDSIRFKLFASGPLPFLILGCFFFGLFYTRALQVSVAFPIFVSRAVETKRLNDLQNKLRDEISDRFRRERGVPEEFLKLFESFLSTETIERELPLRLERELGANARDGRLGHLGQRYLRLVERYNADRDLTPVLELKDDIIASDEDDISRRFVALAWTETALPLLGFLGTVLGLSGALSQIRLAVIEMLATENAQAGGTDSASAQILALFTEGFKELALAFDTTFLGLTGVLILGFIHARSKKRLAWELSETGDSLSGLVTQWRAANPVAVAISSVDDEIKKLRKSIDETKDGLSQAIWRVLSQVENPPFPSIYKALIPPHVGFEKLGDNLNNSVSSVISAEFSRAWHFAGLAPLFGSDNGFVAHIRAQDKENHLLCFDNTVTPTLLWQYNFGKNSITRICSSPSPKKGLVLDQDQKPVLVSGDHALSSPFGDSPVRHCSSARLENQSVVFVIRDENARTQLEIYGPGESAISTFLTPEIDWEHFAQDSLTAAIAIAGKKSNSDREWRVGLVRPRRDPDGGVSFPNDNPEVSFRSANWIESVQILSPDELVMIDTEGTLLYWHADSPNPVRLRHRNWQSNPDTKIFSGHNGWIAVIARNEISMWRIGKGERFYPYPERALPIVVDQKGVFVPTYSGDQLLFTAQGSALLTGWEFPTD